MHDQVQLDPGGDDVATEGNEEVAETPSEPAGEKSFFARGALIGLLGGTVVALLLISVGGSVVSLVDDVFGSSTAAVADDEPASGDDPLIAAGRNLTATCIGCHSTDGSVGVGPSWQGVAGSDRLLESGETVVADSEYLRTSIVDPNVQIVSGFSPDQMPGNYGDTFSADELDALVAYLESL